jgi:mono/diheme cytochrome c family protein
MKPCGLFLILAMNLGFATISFGEETTAIPTGEQLFALKIRPLLAEKCLACHGKDREKIESNLDLTTRAGMIKGGDVSDQVLVPKSAEKSLLYIATTWEDPSCEMPPKENDRLAKEQTWWIRDWINAGAPWPDEETIARIVKADEKNQQGLIAVKTSGGLSEEWNSRRYKAGDLWAYRPLSRPEIPWDALDDTQARHPIEAFIQARLNEAKLKPAPPADALMLLRRVTYDLTGLPPTPGDVQEFLGSCSSGRSTSRVHAAISRSRTSRTFVRGPRVSRRLPSTPRVPHQSSSVTSRCG